MTNPCPFCDRSKIAGLSLVGLGCMLFPPLNPVVPGHMLVAPVRHVEDAAEDPAITGAAFHTASDLLSFWRHSAQLGEGSPYPRATDWNLITSIGPAATQTVRHLHIHLVPRTQGDGLCLPWSGQSRG